MTSPAPRLIAALTLCGLMTFAPHRLMAQNYDASSTPLTEEEARAMEAIAQRESPRKVTPSRETRIRSVDDPRFKDRFASEQGVVVIVAASSCGAVDAVFPIIEELVARHNLYDAVYIEQQQQLTGDFVPLGGFPAFAHYKSGKLVHYVVGGGHARFTSEELFTHIFQQYGLISPQQEHLLDDPRATLPKKSGDTRAYHLSAITRRTFSETLHSALFWMSSLHHVTFAKHKLRFSHWSGATLDHVTFRDMDLTGATMLQLTTKKMRIERSNFDGAQLSGDLSQITWIDSTCPDGEPSDPETKSCEGHMTARMIRLAPATKALQTRGVTVSGD